MPTIFFIFLVVCGAVMQRPGESDLEPANPEMQKLAKAFAGNWKTQEVFAHNEFYPKGAERQGTARFTLATGGTSLMEEVHSDGSAGRLDFIAIIWWDKDAQTYRVFTCGNGGNNPCKLRGTAHWDGASFSNEYELRLRGADRKWRDTFSEIKVGSFKLVAAMDDADGTFQPAITTYYTRK
ncbi:MAG TPA: DUF1579 family protein [Candidatus Acidoferrum sp.]